MLALSARHLAVEGDAERRELFHVQAIELQNAAISLFNAMAAQRQKVAEMDDAVAMLLFSSCISRHSITDVLATGKQSADLDSFLDRYLHYVQVQYGVTAIYHQYQDMIEGSDLGPLSKWAIKDLYATDEELQKGEETASIRGLLASSTSLSAEDLKAYMNALSPLQRALSQINAKSEDRSREQNWLHLAFNWILLVEEAYRELLRRRLPEAVAVLAHYFVLLHHSRHTWQIGDCGARLLRLAVAHLGDQWTTWIAWPQAAVARDVD
jgi:hypothetical protein